MKIETRYVRLRNVFIVHENGIIFNHSVHPNSDVVFFFSVTFLPRLSQFDFVFANVIMAIIADFMLVYVPAPTVSFAASQKRVGYW